MAVACSHQRPNQLEAGWPVLRHAFGTANFNKCRVHREGRYHEQIGNVDLLKRSPKHDGGGTIEWYRELKRSTLSSKTSEYITTAFHHNPHAKENWSIIWYRIWMRKTAVFDRTEKIGAERSVSLCRCSFAELFGQKVLCSVPPLDGVRRFPWRKRMMFVWKLLWLDLYVSFNNIQ